MRLVLRLFARILLLRAIFFTSSGRGRVLISSRASRSFDQITASSSPCCFASTLLADLRFSAFVSPRSRNLSTVARSDAWWLSTATISSAVPKRRTTIASVIMPFGDPTCLAASRVVMPPITRRAASKALRRPSISFGRGAPRLPVLLFATAASAVTAAAVRRAAVVARRR